jgi:cytochrome c biogenesis protein CcmG/thiol:disulfide interchange protein DsbE
MNEEGKFMRIRTVFVAVGLVAVGVAASVMGAPQSKTAHDSAAVHDPELIDAQGYQKVLEQYRGKPLLMTFWATWCEPCRDEYPMLNELAKQYAPKGLKVVGVNFDQDGDLILMRRFIARYKPIFPNYRKTGGEAEFQQAVFAGWNGALPATFLYAKDGRQVGHMVGAGTRETYEAAIRSLLAADGAQSLLSLPAQPQRGELGSEHGKR